MWVIGMFVVKPGEIWQGCWDLHFTIPELNTVVVDRWEIHAGGVAEMIWIQEYRNDPGDLHIRQKSDPDWIQTIRPWITVMEKSEKAQAVWSRLGLAWWA